MWNPVVRFTSKTRVWPCAVSNICVAMTSSMTLNKLKQPGRTRAFTKKCYAFRFASQFWILIFSQ